MSAELYYYRPLKAYNGTLYKCVGYGAENLSHRGFFEPYFTELRDNDNRFLPGCVISVYKGDIVSFGND